MDTLRSFIAVDLSLSSRAILARAIRRLDVGSGVKWVDPDLLHLTVHFLGYVRIQDVKPVCDAAKEALAEIDPFDLTLGGVGAFPDLERPRVIWIGVREGIESLVAIQEALDEPLAALGYPSDRSRFKPHVTIGRVKREGPDDSLRQSLEEMSQLDGGVTGVDSVVVYHSEPERRGPLYTPLAEIDLGWRV